MLRILVLLAALSATAAQADDKFNGWYPVHKTGYDGLTYSYLMPPMSCFSKPVPAHKLVSVPQDFIDSILPPDAPKGIHLFATHGTVNGLPVIYISDSLPWAISLDIYMHEVAHLLGYEHGSEYGPQ